MADSSIDVPKLLDKIQDTDIGRYLVSILTATGKLPEIDTSKRLDEDTNGEYSLDTGIVNISPNLDLTGWGGISQRPKSGQVLAHELTHAADARMVKTVYTDKNFPSDLGTQIKKFWLNDSADAAQKELAAKTDDDSYRARLDESGAFGVGNTLGSQLGYSPTRPINHLDASRAQDFMVQSELFLRGLKQMIGKK